MKLLVVLGFEAYDKDILRILKEAEIKIFSKSRMSGYKNGDEQDLSTNWFSASVNEYNAIMFFAFTEAEKSQQVMSLVQAFNEKSQAQSKIRAFVMHVEDAV